MNRISPTLAALALASVLPAQSVTSFGSGCAGTVGVPSLDTVDVPRIGESFEMQISGLPVSSANTPYGVIGLSKTMWGQIALPHDLSLLGVPGCTLYVSTDAVGALVNNGGTASWSIPIPPRPLLVGLRIYVQVAAVDLGVNRPVPVVLSNALEVEVGPTNTLLPFAINNAASPALAADVRNLLEVGDRFQYEPDVVAANVIYDGIWAQLLAHVTWTGTNPLNTFQFYNDTNPFTNWGRAFRYTGFSVYAGPVIPFTAGIYTRVDGVQLPAVTLQTYDGSYAEMLVMVDSQTFAHAIQHFNGLPIVEFFSGN